ncbi:MAG: hypothetical protein ACI9JL_004317 [Paracoccaceae bacterium]|jgi:hypothetical protein
MDIVIPVATAFAALGLVVASAVWVNRRYNFSVTPPPPPQTAEEMQWERERASLKLCLRHPYC